MSLTRLDLRGVPATSVAAALPRPSPVEDSVSEAVRSIVEEVRTGGDGAVRDCTHRFDGVQLGNLRVDPQDIASARTRISSDLLDALEVAYGRILAYHRHEAAPVGDFELDGCGSATWCNRCTAPACTRRVVERVIPPRY